MLEKHLQDTNRARIIQLKNKRHNISMGNKTMTEYLLKIKVKVDLIDAFSSRLTVKRYFFYSLNGLQPSYQVFRIVIQTSLQPLKSRQFAFTAL